MREFARERVLARPFLDGPLAPVSSGSCLGEGSADEGPKVSAVMVNDVERVIERHRDSRWEHLDVERRAFAILMVESGFSTVALRQQLSLSSQEVRRLRADPLVRACANDMVLQREATIELHRAELSAMADEVIDVAMAVEPTDMVTGAGALLSVHVHNLPMALRAGEFKSKLHRVVEEKKKDASGVNITLNFGAVSAPIPSAVVIDVTPGQHDPAPMADDYVDD